MAGGGRRTFRHYPPGVPRWTPSPRTVGRSRRAVAARFPHRGPSRSRRSGRREGRAPQEEAPRRLPLPARVLGVDEKDARAVASALGVEGWVAEDGGAYRRVAAALGREG